MDFRLVEINSSPLLSLLIESLAGWSWRRQNGISRKLVSQATPLFTTFERQSFQLQDCESKIIDHCFAAAWGYPMSHRIMPIN
jgi:hypothetical protein